MYSLKNDLASRLAMGGFQASLRWLRRVLPQRSLDVEPVADWALSFETPRRIRSAEVNRITCLEGTAWLTIEGQLNDVILTPGQTHFLLPKELGLLAGAPTCRVRITASRSTAFG